MSVRALNRMNAKRFPAYSLNRFSIRGFMLTTHDSRAGACSHGGTAGGGPCMWRHSPYQELQSVMQWLLTFHVGQAKASTDSDVAENMRLLLDPCVRF